jgi:hypothetical protein
MTASGLSLISRREVAGLRLVNALPSGSGQLSILQRRPPLIAVILATAGLLVGLVAGYAAGGTPLPADLSVVNPLSIEHNGPDCRARLPLPGSLR